METSSLTDTVTGTHGQAASLWGKITALPRSSDEGPSGNSDS